MQTDQAEPAPQDNAPVAVSVYPALSISKPPPRRERAMTVVLSTLFGAAFLLAIAGFVQHYLHAP